MAQITFKDLWNRVLLYAPGTPVGLAQLFVKNSYQRILNMHYWSELFYDGEQVIPTIYETGTIALTNGSTTVTGSGTTFTSAMTNRQLLITDAGGQPYYTVTYVSATGLTLDRPYEGATDSSTTYKLGQFYVEFPVNMRTLDDVRDLAQNWRLRRQFHQQNYLDRIDAKRVATGQPTLYVEAPPRVTNGVSYPRYEFWPRITAGTHLVYRYQINHSLDQPSDRPIVVLKPEAIVFGALAELSLWPGTQERPNPFFNNDTHRMYTKMFEDAVGDSESNDIDRSQRMIIYDDDGFGLPADAKWMQQHGIPF